MDVTRIKHIMNSLMILSFIIFGGLVAIIMVTDVSLTNGTVALPFAFLFISFTTLIITGQIDEKPNMVQKYMRDWLVICIIGIVISALAFTFY